MIQPGGQACPSPRGAGDQAMYRELPQETQTCSPVGSHSAFQTLPLRDHQGAWPRDAPCHKDTSNSRILSSSLKRGLQKDSAPSRHSASASLQMCLYHLPLQPGRKKMALDSSCFDNCSPFTSVKSPTTITVPGSSSSSFPLFI